MVSQEHVSLADELLPRTDVQHLMNTEVGRIEDELGEELEHFDLEFDEEYAAEETDEWDRPDNVEFVRTDIVRAPFGDFDVTVD